MANVLLGATGSVAAVRVPALVEALTAAGHAVKVVATDAATYFFDVKSLVEPVVSAGEPGVSAGEPGVSAGEPGVSAGEPGVSAPGGGRPPGANTPGSPADTPGSPVFLDADEWPGERYERGDAVLHIELRKWADVFVIAPLDANTLAKLAVGLCDNCLTCVWRAWDVAKPVVLAPAMNTLMWQHPFTCRHLRAIAAEAGAGHIPGHFDDVQLIAQINDRSRTLRVVSPITKQLACGDVGVGAMAEVNVIVAAVREVVSRAG